MSTANKLTYLNTTKSKIKNAINLAGANLTNEPFRAYSSKLYDRYLDILKNGTSALYSAMPKVTGTGTELSLKNTAEAPMVLELGASESTQDTLLPSEYQQVEYIQSSGTQYIDTGRLSTANTKIEMEYTSEKQAGDAFQPLFGSLNATVDKRIYVLILSANTINLQFPHDADSSLFMKSDGTFTSSSTNANVFWNYGEKKKVILDLPNRSLTIGEYTSISTSTYEILGSNYSILILNRNDATIPSANLAIGKIHSFKWYESNTLVMNLIPCYRISDNEIGLYDLVNDVFYTNAGTGSFAKGANVDTPNPDYPQDINVVTGSNSINLLNKNLFAVRDGINTAGILITKNNNNSYNITGTASSNIEFTTFLDFEESNIKNGETYILSANQNLPAGISSRVEIYNNSTWVRSFVPSINSTTPTTTGTANFTDANRIRYAIVINSGTTLNIENLIIQLEKGTVASTSKLPYKEQTFPLSLLKTNLFDKNNIIYNARIGNDGNNYGEAGYFASDFIEIEENTVYSVNYEMSAMYRIGFYNGNKTFISSEVSNSTFTTPQSAKYLRIGQEIINIDTIKLLNANSSDLELAGIGDYKDKIFNNIPSNPLYDANLVEGGWYKYKMINKLVLDGSEDWVLGGDRGRFDLGKGNARRGSTTNNPIVSSHFISNYSTTNYSIFLSGVKNSICIIYQKVSTLAEFKEWLANNLPVVYYAMTTPTTEQIIDTILISQLEAIKNAISYDDETNINQTNANRPFIISASAISKTMGGE